MAWVWLSWVSGLVVAELALRRDVLDDAARPRERLLRAFAAGLLPQMMLWPWLSVGLIVWVWLVAGAVYGWSAARAAWVRHTGGGQGHPSGRARAVEAWLVQWAMLLGPVTAVVLLLTRNGAVETEGVLEGRPVWLWAWVWPGLAGLVLAVFGGRVVGRGLVERFRDAADDGEVDGDAPPAVQTMERGVEPVDTLDTLGRVLVFAVTGLGGWVVGPMAGAVVATGLFIAVTRRGVPTAQAVRVLGGLVCAWLGGAWLAVGIGMA